MKDIKIFIILLISTLFFSFSSVYAVNIGRSVYGVLTETYNGVAFDAAASNADSVQMQFWSGTMGSADITSNVPEGSKFVRFTLGTQGWAGGGIVAKNTAGYKDMSSYYGGKIKFLAKVSDTKALNFKVGLKMNGSDCLVATLGQLGLTANNTWKELSINLTSATNSNITADNLSKTNILFQFAQDVDVVSGLEIDIDNVRWVKSSGASFNATLKNIDGDTSASQITWSQDVFRTSWKAANQYINIDLDTDVGQTWSMRIYTDNKASDKAGLVATEGGETIVLPMCWRINKEKIPSSDATLVIGEDIYTEGEETKGRLYDAGVAEPVVTYNTWFYFIDSVDKNKSSDNIDYTTAWSQKGFHAAAGPNYWGMEGEIFPKIYLGANFENAFNGNYTSKIILELAYDE